MNEFNLKPLPGHTTKETAYLVDDYPYGFRLRCQIRYWLEYKRSKGFRLCSQTSNPKMSGLQWNKPKCSTYTPLGVMGLNEENHVTWQGISSYYPEKLDAFITTYGTSFDENQRGVANELMRHIRVALRLSQVVCLCKN